MEYSSQSLPPEQLSFNKKTKAWRKAHLDWADSKTFFNYSLCRKSVIHKKINYDLLNGKLHMNDMELILNPEHIRAGFIPDRIQHYPIMNSKLNVLKGEESKRVFDFKVIVTNPNAVSDIENNKKEEIYQRLQQWVSNNSQSDEDANQELEKMSDYFTYEWQDMREIRSNLLLNHYVKELNIPLIFNQGFMDAMTVGEEIYQCSIIGGEPTLEKLNPLKVRIFKSGYSNKIEDADMIVLEDYWSPGRVIDTYYDLLTTKDLEYINKLPDHVGQAATDSMSNIDERMGFVNNYMIGDEITSQEGFFWDPLMTSEGIGNTLLPYDIAGNLRVLRVYWKSRRKIKKVRSYNKETGEEEFHFYPETYILKTDEGEEEQIFYINEAWEGTKIGTDIYVNMRPRVVQYNRLSNPSRCHFGIIGSIYNLNDSRPFSLVDMMKPYSYLYDIIHDRLNKLIARNWGTLIRYDFAKNHPKGWDVEKWLYYAKTMGIAVEDSFNEGNIGAATGKLAGAMNNASNGVIAASDGNQIQQYMNLLEFIKMEMSDVAGISKQREGQISNRETVGGVERATLQSSYITEWLFTIHDDVKKRVLECFIETAKAALKGRSKKFQYILNDGSMQVMNIDGDEFAECDYGLVVDNSNSTQLLSQKLDTLAQAALQNQTLSFSTIMQLYNSSSLIEKQRMVENNEKQIQERQQQQQQEQLKQQQQALESQMLQKESELKQKEEANIRDNETKVLIANIQAEGYANMNDGIQEPDNTQENKDKLIEQMREFDTKIKLERDKLVQDKEKHDKEIAIKRAALNKQVTTKSN
jgi:hypothetical protein